MTDARTQAAAQHLRTAAAHMPAGEVSRSAAHLLAGRGHLLKAGATLDALAVEHAARSHPTPD